MRILTFLFLVASAAAQNTDWTSTNQVSPYSAPVNIPQVTVPQITVPQVHSVEIPSGTNTPPAPPKPIKRNNSYLFAPSANDVGRRGMVATPPVLPQTPITTLQTNMPAAPSPVAGGRTWFVDAYGADNNAGTSQRPFRTIQRAAALAQPGETVLVAPGTYEGFHTARSGEKSRPITFRAPTGNATIESSPLSGGINVKETDYIVIEGFTIRGAQRAGISVLSSRGCVLQNNSIAGSAQWGVLAEFAPETEILNNTIRSVTGSAIFITKSRTADDRIVVRGNECSGNANGIQFSGDCKAGGDGLISGALIEANTIHDNSAKALVLVSVSDSLVQNNLIHNNGGTGVYLGDTECAKPSTNNILVNNTIDASRVAGIEFGETCKDNFVFNNVIVSVDPVVGAAGQNQIDEKSNVLRITSDGLFQSPSSGNYRLLQSSLARRAGQNVYQGRSAPKNDLAGQPRSPGWVVDAGAFE